MIRMPHPYCLPEYLSFLSAIREQPDDDLHRLVAADWLEEHGESERAEFIRVQCEIAAGKCTNTDVWGSPCGRYETEEGRRRLSCEWCKRKPMLKARERELWETPGAMRWANFPDISIEGTVNRHGRIEGMYAPNITAKMDRGFLESIRIHGADWIKLADEILRLNPVRAVTLIWGNGGTLTMREMEEFWPDIVFTLERFTLEREEDSPLG